MRRCIPLSVLILWFCVLLPADDAPTDKPSEAAAAEPPPIPDIKAVQAAEAEFEKQAAAIEADAAKRLADANKARLAVYKAALDRATKAGKLQEAVAIDARLKVCESETPALTPRKGSKSLSIISAAYGVNQSWFDVTEKLKKEANGKPRWSAVVSDVPFGDPAPNYDPGNTLLVRYSINGMTRMKAFYAGTKAELP